LGNDIESDINAYKEKINNCWSRFKNGSSNYSDTMKQLLIDILDRDNLNVKVDIAFDTDRMYNVLLEQLDRRSYSVESLKKRLNIDSVETFYDFIKQSKVFDDGVGDKLREELLNLLYKEYTKFILHNIIVTSNNKNITKLSHGQQGTIYLRIKIAANLFSQTIIYDQPEDDLDNSFIMSDLVDIFRKIKKYRQVIIVSHNANLVVNADSEQVIVADNEEGILKYISGSLENPEINKLICKILEGGKSAFLNRKRKYQISD